MMQMLLDSDPAGDKIDTPSVAFIPESQPTQGEMLIRGIGGAVTHPGRMARTLYRTARSVWESNELLGSAAQAVGLDRLPLAKTLLERRGAEIDAD
jgi:hypothetical protein